MFAAKNFRNNLWKITILLIVTNTALSNEYEDNYEHNPQQEYEEHQEEVINVGTTKAAVSKTGSRHPCSSDGAESNTDFPDDDDCTTPFLSDNNYTTPTSGEYGDGDTNNNVARASVDEENLPIYDSGVSLVCSKYQILISLALILFSYYF